MDTKISKLNPGESMVIGRTESGYCTVERSGNGRTIRFVRYAEGGFQVFRTCEF